MNENGSGLLSGLLFLIGGGIIFLLSKSFFPHFSKLLIIGGVIIIVFIVILVLTVMYFAFKKPKEKIENLKEKEIINIINKGRANVMELRSNLMRVKDKEIRKQGEDICNLVNKILEEAKKQKEDPTKIRQYLNYYLPTTLNIIIGYQRLESCNKLEADSRENVISCLKGVMEASEKQYDNLFEDDILDLTVEMEVLNTMCKKDGLL